MLVSHRKRFIYTKTMKTGGTSVEVYFEPYCVPEGEWTFADGRDEYVSEAGIIGFRGSEPVGRKWFNHMSAAALREQLGVAVWDDYFKFCVIRDPFDKMISMFHFVDGRGDPTPLLRARRSLRARGLTSKTSTIRRFREWVARGGEVDDRDKYVIDGELCLDHFIRYEQLETGVGEVCARLEIPFNPGRIRHLKGGMRTRGISVKEYYDSETAEKVAERYAFEFEHFGYPDRP